MTKTTIIPEPFVSVVVCVYNEADNIRPLILEIDTALSGMFYEIIYVNDGSTDRTLKELTSLSHKYLTVIDFQRNYGQSQALAAGIEAAKGQYIVTLDGDLQNDPADIPSLLKVAQSGNYDLVATIRLKRKDSFFSRRLPSLLANWLIRTLVGVPLKDYGSTLKVFKASLAKKLPLYGELHRFIPVLSAIEGARMAEILVKHRPRLVGESKYNMGRTVKVISDLFWVIFMKKYLLKPIHFFGQIAFWMIVLACLLGCYMGCMWLARPTAPFGLLPIAALILVIAGVHSLGIGIIAELVMRTLFESQGKKPYTIRNVYGPKVPWK
jgi:glycosyltransferase involved in cell wall biosynthesis